VIVLTATQVNVFGHVRFTIAVDGLTHSTTDDAIEAETILHELGVATPFRLVEHTREWGSVEIGSIGAVAKGVPKK
jgi:hypothetical protein